MEAMDIQVRAIEPQDQAQWRELYLAYADFYQVAVDEKILANIWQWLFSKKEFYGLVACQKNACQKKTQADDGVDEVILGFMHYRSQSSPLRGCDIGFLDDLYVMPQARGRGVAKALFAQLEQEAAAQQWPMVRWLTAENNYRARSLYDNVGEKTPFLTYQMLGHL